MASKSGRSGKAASAAKAAARSAKAQARAAEREARLAELERVRQAEQRRRTVMVGVVVTVVLVLLVASAFWLLRPDEVDAVPAGQSDYGVTIGPEDAPHELVVYEDFLCPACGSFEAATGEQLAQLAEEGQVYVDYRPFELLSQFGDYSARSVAAFGVVLQTSGPEVAKEFHDLLYADQPEEGADSYPDAESLIATAVQAGADEDAVRAGIEEGENDFSDGATAEAREAGVDRTPTIVLDGATFDGSADDLLATLRD
jgi:protein-disulfide isomerase